MSVVVVALAMLLVAVLAAEPLLAALPSRKPKRHSDWTARERADR